MVFKASILNVPATLFIIGCLIYTVYNYKTLSAEEGWGIVYMVGLCGLGLLLLLIDLAIQNIFRSNRTIVNIVEVVVVIAAVISVFIKF